MYDPRINELHGSMDSMKTLKLGYFYFLVNLISALIDYPPIE